MNIKNITKKTKTGSWLCVLVLVLLTGSTILAQTTGFTYQGSLSENDAPADGNYDFEFILYDAISGGSQVGSTLVRPNVAVTGGVFSVELDFGDVFPGAARFLEIRVRPAAPLSGSKENVGTTYSTLSPRQEIKSVPYAITSISAGTADSATTADTATTAGSATTADTATNALNLGGVAAGQYVQTDDPRLSDDRNPTAGSPDYIQNSTTEQPSSDFNISGTGKADILDAFTEFRIGGIRVMSIDGTDNLFIGSGAGTNNTAGNNVFVGTDAGQLNTSGRENVFVGSRTGANNTTGVFNSFFGQGAGFNHTTGNANNFFGKNAGFNSTNGANNSFFGSSAGFDLTSGQGNSFFGNNSGGNTTTGGLNTFAGRLSGLTNTTGSNNSLLGHSADVGANNLVYATAIGADAVVTSSNRIQLGRDGTDIVRLGRLGAASTTFLCFNGSSEIAACTNVPLTDPRAFIRNQTNQQGSSNFHISGEGTANIFDADTQFNLNGDRILSNAGSNNLFAGADAGNSNTTGVSNSFFGDSAGFGNTSGSFNSFFGNQAGRSNTTSTNNSFFGYNAGGNTTGDRNSFFGSVAGLQNTTGLRNSFFGVGAGSTNTTGSRNTFVGTFAGGVNTTGSNNTLIGYDADVGSNNLTYATAIGSEAVVTASNRIQLGRNGTDVVRIGTTGSAGSTDLCLNASNILATCSSSIRYKTGVIDFTPGLDVIRRLRPVFFKWKDGGMPDLGLVAEEVSEIEPLLTNEKNGRVEGVKYDRLGVVLVNAVQEQQSQIREQQEIIDSQNERIEALEKKLERQRVEMESIRRLICAGSDAPCAPQTLSKEENEQ